MAALVLAVKQTSCVEASTSKKRSSRRRAVSITSLLARDGAESECGLPNSPDSNKA